MQIAILHLTDLHIKTPSDPILFRTSQIRDAFHGSAPNAEACVILLSGDIAFSGTPLQYDLALSFLNDLKALIDSLPSIQAVRFVAVPGNHDCDFSQESDIREFLLRDVAALYKSGIDLDGDKARTLLSVQHNFFQFEAKLLDAKELPVQSRIAWGRLFSHGNVGLKFQCFNTAWLSRKEEQQSKLFLPPKALEPYPGDASISISVFHHPYNWLDANNYRQLRATVEQTSDFVFTGHEHEFGGIVVERFSGEHLHYVEGAALQGEGGILDSGFNVVLWDIATAEQRLEFFRWNGEFYSSKNRQEWGSLIKNPVRERHLLRINDEFYSILIDVGTAFTHRRSRNLTLPDIYVYPRLSVWSADSIISGKKSTPVGSKAALDYFKANRRVLVIGAEDSGKSSLLKTLYIDLSNDYVPLLLNASRLHGRMSEQRFRNLIRELIIEQYDESSVERYFQMSPERLVLLVDDLHRTNLSRREELKFVQFTESMFGRVIVTASDLYRIREFSRQGTLDDPFRAYDRCEIKEFGHFLRAALIKRWLLIGRDTVADLESLDHDVATTEKIVTSLLGKNVVPSYPFSILTILQLLESGKGYSTAVTSYGALYEVLIKSSLSFVANEGAQEIDIKFTFISLIAYFMFDHDTTTVTHRELKALAEEYNSTFHIQLDLHHAVANMTESRVLDHTDGNYTFKYRHVYYYFVAKYFDRVLRKKDSTSDTLRERLTTIADRLHNEEFANIVLFYVHLSQDWELVRHIVSNANRIYSGTPPCDLTEQVGYVNRLYKEKPKPLLVDTTDIEKNQDTYRENMDTAEENGRDIVPLDAKVTYDDALADIHKVNIALKTLQVLGQVLRSAAASLEGREKHELIKTSYLLGLRTLTGILDLAKVNLNDLRYYLASLIRERAAAAEADINEQEILKRTDEAVINLTQHCAFGIVKKISLAVGHQRLAESYDLILSELSDNLAVRFVDLQIKLDHFNIVPEYDVVRLRDQVAGNRFALVILTRMIGDFLYLYRVDIRTAQKLGSLFQLKSTLPEMLLPEFKKN